MYIGDVDVGSKFDQDLDAGLVLGVKYRMNDNYVSWRPDANKSYLTTSSEPMEKLADDHDAEDGEAHVKYTLYGLDVALMRATWQSIRDKPGSHYKLHAKNCSTIVARVLRAGGASDRIGAKSVWFSHSAIWTPKKLSQLCNKLRDKGYATKEKWGTCPSKNDSSKLHRFFGLR